jgi:hypothetical protein
MANNNIEGMLTGVKEEKEVMKFGDLECRMREDGKAECRRGGEAEFKVFGDTPSTLGDPIEDIKVRF